MDHFEPIRTRSARWGWSDHRYFGFAVFGELMKEPLSGMTALSVLGRRLSAEELAVLDEAAVALTLADPRIWPLKMTRVLASYGNTLSAAGAGMMVQEEARVGAWTGCRAAELLLEFRQQVGDQIDDRELLSDVVRRHLAKHHFVWGFGTPFRGQDERLAALCGCVERRGREKLTHWRLFRNVAQVVGCLRSWEPNVGMGIAACFLDMGMSPREVGVTAAALMQHMFMAHAAEASVQQAPQLQKLPDERVVFAGHPPRLSPRASQRLEAGETETVRSP